MLTKCIEFNVVALIRPNGEVIISDSHHWINIDSVSHYRWWTQSAGHRKEILSKFKAFQEMTDVDDREFREIQTEVVMTDGTILYTKLAPLEVYHLISEAYSAYEEKRSRKTEY